MGTIFEIFIAVLLVSFFSLFCYIAITNSNKKEDCSKRCGIYKSTILDKRCYCNSMPQSWIEIAGEIK
jgi:hypothetical protein